MRNGFLGLLLVACGGDDSPDSPSGDTGPSVVAEPAWTADPIAGTINVPPLQSVRFTFEQDVDPASLAGATVTFVDAFARPVAAELTAAGPTVTVDPRLALALDQTFTVEVSGLALADGTAAGSVSTSFEMHPTLQVAVVETPGGLQVTAFDDEGRRIRVVRYPDEGPDGEFETSDDVQGSRDDITYDAEGRESTRVQYTSPGLDGAWQTGDDVATRQWTWSYEGGVAIETETSVGDDGVLGTADDEFERAQRIETRDGVTITLSSRGAGTDDVLFTNDDALFGCRRIARDTFGNEVEASFCELGADGLPFTDDDVLDGLQLAEVDALGRIVEVAQLADAGPDTVWRTADDTIDFILSYELDDDGLRTRGVFYSAPGADQVWRTSDDEIAFYDAYERTADGVNERIVTYDAPGLDGVWFVGDDEIAEYRGFPVDENGFVRAQFDVRNPGGDGSWFTGDDVVNYREAYQTPLAPRRP